MNDTNDNLRSIILFNSFSYVDRTFRHTLTTLIDNYSKNSASVEQTDLANLFYDSLIHSTKTTAKEISLHLRSGVGEDNSGEVYGKAEILDKVDICLGILSNASIKKRLKFLKMPIIYVYSKNNSLITLKHSDIIRKVSL